ncbi:MAG: hypothetical protein HOO06_15495 [Bdellovibrionaceae bacterium]|jgi:hypothetical protein|nr:hypothetical protein [Pseudobdellovibrionaceae bacterium]
MKNRIIIGLLFSLPFSLFAEFNSYEKVRAQLLTISIEGVIGGGVFYGENIEACRMYSKFMLKIDAVDTTVITDNEKVDAEIFQDKLNEVSLAVGDITDACDSLESNSQLVNGSLNTNLHRLSSSISTKLKAWVDLF